MTGDLLSTALVGGATGLVGAVAMNPAMVAMSEGTTPPRVAAGVLSGRSPDAVDSRSAWTVHHLAGVVAGVLFALVRSAAAAVPGVADRAASSVAVAATVVVLYGFFSLVVLPRTDLPAQRLPTIRYQWGLLAVLYGATLGVCWTLV